MADIDRYLQAATRDHTRRSYQSAIRHFEQEWGGFLPASADSVARYLAEHAQTLSIKRVGRDSCISRQNDPKAMIQKGISDQPTIDFSFKSAA
ncbi:hypothetical protein [Ralstonia mannitolilytica]|uniref:hypothetical protein n=1 Tax=Ralstonia mannitolilytica TaxID=105219 RepID=UPI002155F0AB|nr:hypothetical protein [Ralstonia mannitolilytica]